MTTPPRLVRSLNRASGFPQLVESFVVAGVVSVLGIRAFLSATGFPRIGTGELHIAHMLWGGALMLVALLLLIAYIDRRVEHTAVVIAGLGFGAFIDEIGKVVTADNDYFFRPAIALIYAAFVVVFLVARALAGSTVLAPHEAMANALDLLARTAGRPLDDDDRGRLHALLASTDGSDDLRRALTAYVDAAPVAVTEDGLPERLVHGFRRAYRAVAVDPRFGGLLTAGVLAYAAIAIVASSIVVIAGVGHEAASVSRIGQAVSSIVGGALVAIGAVALPSSRERAYQWFIRGFLVWILVTQVFAFYVSQLAGIGGLALDLAAYGLLRYALGQERLARARAAAV